MHQVVLRMQHTEHGYGQTDDKIHVWRISGTQLQAAPLDAGYYFHVASSQAWTLLFKPIFAICVSLSSGPQLEISLIQFELLYYNLSKDKNSVGLEENLIIFRSLLITLTSVNFALHESAA